MCQDHISPNLYFEHLIHSLAIKASEHPQLLLKPRGHLGATHSSLFWALHYCCMVPGDWKTFLLSFRIRKKMKWAFLNSWATVMIAENLGICVGGKIYWRTWDLEVNVTARIWGFQTLKCFDCSISHLLRGKRLLQVLNLVSQRTTLSPTKNPIVLSSDRKYFQNNPSEFTNLPRGATLFLLL